MRKARCLFIGMLVLAMASPLVGWGAASSPGEGKAPVPVVAKDGPATLEKAEAEEAEKRESGEGKQEEAKEDECPATFGPLITDTAIPTEKGKFVVQPTFGLSAVTNNFTDSWRRVSAGGNFLSYEMSLKMTYGLFNNMEVYTVIPYVHNWAGSVDERGPGGERSSDFGGLGDISLTFKYRVVEETETLPTISAVFTPTFPSGHYRHLNPRRLGTDAIGGGAYVLTPGFNVSKYMKPFIVYGNLYYSMQTDFTDDDGPQHPRDFVTANLAVEYPFTSKWVGCLELTSSWDTGRLFGQSPNAPPAALVSLAPEIEYMATDKLSFSLGVNVDLVGRNTAAAVTPLLSAVYAF
jgi:hypothetical protein